MKVPVSKLSGFMLDMEVAKAVHGDEVIYQLKDIESAPYVEIFSDENHGQIFEPTSNWKEMGRLIESYQLSLTPHASAPGVWIASSKDHVSVEGKSPQEAMLRAIVMGKFGPMVTIDDELSSAYLKSLEGQVPTLR